MATLTDGVTGRVLRIFREDLQVEVNEDLDVLGNGALDSLVFVQLLARLEEEFGLTVDVERLDLDDFRSVSSIARYVSETMDGG